MKLRIPLPKKVEKIHIVKKDYNRKRDKKEIERKIIRNKGIE